MRCTGRTLRLGAMVAVVVALADGVYAAELELKVRPYADSVLVGEPLLLSLSLVNVGSNSVSIGYAPQESEALIRDGTLVLRAASGTTVRVGYERAGAMPIAAMTARVAAIDFRPGDSVRGEWVNCLVSHTRNEGGLSEWRAVGPGVYTAYMELAPGGLPVRSTPFVIEVQEPAGLEADARQLLELQHLNFLDGKESPASYARYREGRVALQGSEHKRFEVIDDLARQFPKSRYTKWIEFWKLGYYGPAEEALRYAREHRDFQLADNLMLRVAEGYFNGKDYAQARTVTEELLRDFPDGDTHTRAVELQQRLSKKP